MTRPIKTPLALAEAGLISKDEADALRPVADHYAIAITPFLAERIDRNDADDPIARMFIPRAEELTRTPEELEDPIGDAAHTPVPGIVHRYPNRVLLKPVAVCPVYCRFCFRREMVGPDLGDALSPAALREALDYVRAHPEISEVILTGGDPFMLSPARARRLTEDIAAIPHVSIIRWHTRMPVADPARITPAFISAITDTDKAVYVSVHINHIRELSPETRSACARMAKAGIQLLSQSVLLRGVNDTVDALAELMQALVGARVKPYYLHHPDLAPGTGHFRLSLAEGQALYTKLRNRVSGLAVPRYVVDIPGGVSKANAAPADIVDTPGGKGLLGRDGLIHPYQG